MISKPLITFVFGTRPEAIKLAPVILTFISCPKIKIRVVLSGQHREMVSQVLDMFEIKPDKDLNIMKHSQSLTDITSKTLVGLEQEFNQFKPDLVLVQGDTTSAFAAAIASFYAKVPVGHIEAGLRTDDIFNPFPEEINRRLISQLASINFAPTLMSAKNLAASKLIGDIHITGNTVIDALQIISKDLPTINIPNLDWENNKVILTTIHRRENWGANLDSICDGLIKVIKEFDNVIFVIPMHKNKLVREPLKRYLGDLSRVFLLEPFDYKTLLGFMKNCFCILSDSGGIQEEAPSFKKPILILRETTERKEIIDTGKGILIGTDSENILKFVSKLLIDNEFYKSMVVGENPFGDGKSSKRILNICLEKLGINNHVDNI